MKAIFLCIAVLLAIFAVTLEADEELKGIRWIKKKTNMRGFTKKEQQFMLRTHNAYRRAVAKAQYGHRKGAANMRRMTWNDDLARDAQRWADHCGGGMHNDPSERGYSGQNYVAHGDRVNLIKLAFQGWCDKEVGKFEWEKRDYKGKYEYLSTGSGHYTQVIWARSNELGCGFAECPGYPYGRLVCHYMNVGNFNELLVYEPGRACSDCDPGFGFCFDGLCSRRCRGKKCVCKVKPTVCKQNGGTFDQSRCVCKCPAGKKGLNCEKACTDNDKNLYCDPQQCKRGTSLYMQMEAFCDKTCGRCEAKSGPAVDNNPQCPTWAKRGECKVNPEYMLKNCKKSCGVA